MKKGKIKLRPTFKEDLIWYDRFHHLQRHPSRHWQELWYNSPPSLPEQPCFNFNLYISYPFLLWFVFNGCLVYEGYFGSPILGWLQIAYLA